MNAPMPSPGEAATKARTTEPLYGGATSRRVTVRDIAAGLGRGDVPDGDPAGDGPAVKGFGGPRLGRGLP